MVIPTLRYNGGSWSQKKISALWVSVWSKNKGGGASPGSATGPRPTNSSALYAMVVKTERDLSLVRGTYGITVSVWYNGTSIITSLRITFK